MQNNTPDTTPQRRSFLRNLSLFSAASLPAAWFARKAHAAAIEPLQLAQADAPTSKPAAKPVAAPVAERGDFNTLQDIVFAAKKNLQPELWTHLTGGSDSETTIRRNRLAYESLALRQRVLNNVEHIDIATTFLGQKLELPVFVCPVGGYTGMAHPQGIVTVVRGAEAAGTTAICASNVRPGFAAAAKAAKHPLIYQLYITSDRKWVGDRLDAIKALGFRALCVTVDRNYYSRRERDLIGGFERAGAGDDQRHQARLNWDDVVWMKQHVKLPLILKGIATAEDARLAVEHGADVVYISNHGGRQIDQGEGTLDVLPEVVRAVRGRAEVVIDGGVLRGSDVVKAVALGARAVGVGKLMGYALAAGGEAGVRRMLELLAIEIRTTMGLMGVAALKDLNPSYVKKAMPVTLPTVTSAFPWFEEQTRKM